MKVERKVVKKGSYLVELRDARMAVQKAGCLVLTLVDVKVDWMVYYWADTTDVNLVAYLAVYSVSKTAVWMDVS